MPPTTPDSSEIYVDERPVTWKRDGAISARPLFLFAHGAGAPSTSPFMQTVSAALVERGIAVVRFHFPYMERHMREGRRMPPDPTPRLVETCRRMFELVQSWLPPAQRARPPIAVGGKSMGGRIWSLLLSTSTAPPAAAAVYLGYPLHGAGRAGALRASHLDRVHVPQLFVSGSKDPLARLDALEPAVRALGPGASLHLVQGGDHSLATSRRDPFALSHTWLDAMVQFLNAHAADPTCYPPTADTPTDTTQR